MYRPLSQRRFHLGPSLFSPIWDQGFVAIVWISRTLGQRGFPCKIKISQCLPYFGSKAKADSAPRRLLDRCRCPCLYLLLGLAIIGWWYMAVFDVFWTRKSCDADAGDGWCRTGTKLLGCHRNETSSKAGSVVRAALPPSTVRGARPNVQLIFVYLRSWGDPA